MRGFPRELSPVLVGSEGLPHSQCTPREGQQYFRTYPLPDSHLGPCLSTRNWKQSPCLLHRQLCRPSQAWLVPGGWDACGH